MAKHVGGSKRGKHGKSRADPGKSRAERRESQLSTHHISVSSAMSFDLGFDLEGDPALDSSSNLHGEARWNAAVTSDFLPVYYRNERHHLQCFPTCAEFGDYAIGKRQGKTHRQRAGCQFPIATTIRTPFSGFAYNDVICLGRIRSENDDDAMSFQVGQTFDFTFVQSLMLPEGGEASGSGSSAVAAAAASPLASDLPKFVRGINPAMENADGVQLLGDRKVPIVFSPPGGRWNHRDELAKKKSRHKTYQFVFEMLVFYLPVNPDVNSELRYQLVCQEVSPSFEIASTRKLKRELAGGSTSPTGPVATPNSKKSIKTEASSGDSNEKQRSKRKNPSGGKDKRKKAREEAKKAWFKRPGWARRPSAPAARETRETKPNGGELGSKGSGRNNNNNVSGGKRVDDDKKSAKGEIAGSTLVMPSPSGGTLDDGDGATAKSKNDKIVDDTFAYAFSDEFFAEVFGGRKSSFAKGQKEGHRHSSREDKKQKPSRDHNDEKELPRDTKYQSDEDDSTSDEDDSSDDDDYDDVEDYGWVDGVFDSDGFALVTVNDPPEGGEGAGGITDDSNISRDILRVRGFLRALKLSECEEALVENGYDTMARLFEAEREDLLEIGLKRGHANQLVRATTKFKQARRKAKRKARRDAKNKKLADKRNRGSASSVSGNSSPEFPSNNEDDDVEDDESGIWEQVVALLTSAFSQLVTSWTQVTESIWKEEGEEREQPTNTRVKSFRSRVSLKARRKSRRRSSATSRRSSSRPNSQEIVVLGDQAVVLESHNPRFSSPSL